MSELGLRALVLAAAILGVACGRAPLDVPADSTGQGGAGGKRGPGGHAGVPGGGAGGSVFVRLPDGGIASLLGDSGILGGITDAPRDSLLGQMICGPGVRFGAPCVTSSIPCLLPSLGGACLCVGGSYLCPLDPTAAPQPCPAGAATGAACFSLMSVCVGGGANGCLCMDTYTCF